MPLFDPPHCPNCESLLPLSDVRREVFRITGLFGKKFGIRCTVCRSVLKVKALRPWALIVSMDAFVMLGLAWIGTLRPKPIPDEQLAPALILLFGIGALVVWRWIPRFAQVRPLEPGEQLTIEAELSILDDMSDEDKSEIADRAEWAESVKDASRVPWRCESCGEENPATFDICWKCQSARPESKQN